MSLTQPLRLKGAPGSPYTRKMLAYLRYRHIAYELLIGDHSAENLGLPRPKVDLLPTFYLPDEKGEIEAVVDSTPLIRRFESGIPGRAAIPENPVLGFINYLIEDYADEWLTKSMFHYRWYFDADIRKAGNILPLWRGLQMTPEMHEQAAAFVSDRQISRLYVVGSNEVTAPVIESSYRRFLQIMDSIIARQTFVFGARPSSADFGLYAQLTQLAKFDPTPMAICLQEAPRVFAWTDVIDDLSGQVCEDNGWMAVGDVREVLGPLLKEIGRTYVPALLANAKALNAGDKHMQTTIDGKRWEQPTFPYQARCLAWINEEYQKLSPEDRAQVDEILAGTGCEEML
ncbi:MAG: glutathione S-transferase family protein [Pseudomonadales bacterium]|nr:glutathione S-transferase family protein [Pseudomonadales bacterium]MBO6597225.1 glutathione S-transferase family protein [Pseudomonadales bacterium]MBO6655269.1 glutathione S-transferase family protein [Pseudomonadales bacterium]MBO6703854.1 glutathione S-transferase family protein [Pseudomonadales bacterium]MBO6823589.1 glutathione S-transferase family protein [Pseudomonadales bacterium]